MSSIASFVLDPIVTRSALFLATQHSAELQPRGRLDVMGGQGGVGASGRGPLPRLARLTEAISGVLDDYTMVSGQCTVAVLAVLPRHYLFRPGRVHFFSSSREEGLFFSLMSFGIPTFFFVRLPRKCR